MSIANKRIFFGHQSVGSNIINGIRRLGAVGPELNIVETRSPDNHGGPCLFHAAVGRNQDPSSKIKDFITLMNSGFGDNVDTAGFKFCYIDINHSTDVETIFSEYRDAMDFLADQFTQTQFLHITVPLRTVEPSTRLFVKRILGKKSIALADNSKRHSFNELMRKTYSGKQPIFDLARAQSTYLSGKHLSHAFEGDLVYSLIPEYTYDGGHLNKRGQQIIGQQFVDCIEQITWK